MDITVVVPCYNSEKTLKRCLDSLLSQSIPVKILVINDGSTDSTLEIALRYADQYGNVQVVSQANRGLPQARKAGVDQCTTKYTAFVDSDDWVDGKMMETLYRLSQTYDADVSVCGLYYERGNKTMLSNQSISGNTCVDGQDALSLVHRRQAVFPYMCNKLFLTGRVREMTFPEGNFIGEDYITLAPSLEQFDRVAIINKPLYHYVQKVGSMSKNGYGPGHRTAYENYMVAYTAYEKNHTPRQISEMANYLCVEFAAIYVAMVRNSNYDDEVSRGIRHFLREHIIGFLKSECGISYKASAALIAICPALFNFSYGMYDRMISR